MQIGEYSQARLTADDADEDAHGEAVIGTNGRQIRPITALLSHIASEFKLHVTADGIWTTHIDPANVALAEISVYSEAFESYELDGDEFVTGVFGDKLHTAVKPARKPQKDPVGLRIDSNRTLVSVTKEYSTGTVEWTDRVLNIDPDAVRKEPDTSSDHIRDNYVEWSARVETRALADVFEHVNSVADHVEFAENDGRLQAHSGQSGRTTKIDANDDKDKAKNPTETAIDFGPVAKSLNGKGTEGASSLFSIDYLTDQAAGLKNASVFDVTVSWGDGVPIIFDFEKADEDENVLMEGSLMLAPRITSDD